MKTTTYIYSLSDPLTEEVRYIGKSNNVRRRYTNHLIVNANNHKNCWIKSLQNKGLKPKLEIVDEVLIDDWKFWEEFYILLFKSWGFKLTNSNNGGVGSNGVKGDKHYNFGKTLSLETKDKIRLKKLGIKSSEETKKKQSESLKKIIHTKEWSNKISESHKGKVKTEEHIRKIAEGKCKKVMIDNVIYKSFTQAMKDLNVSSSYISRRLKSEEHPNYKYIENE